MAATMKDMERMENVELGVEVFELVHPLYDAPEVKRSAEGLGKMTLRPAAWVSLFVLRAYLVVMMLLVFYSVLHQAGALGH